MQQVIDRYELFEELGAGAFGRVYRARHRVLDRVVALKVLEIPGERERFVGEAAILARLDHPNIIRVHDSGTTREGHAFLALELLEGETLAQRLRSSGAQPVTEASWIVDQVLAALEAAHAQGIVHRDLKHPNVFLARQGDGVMVKVLDLGIAKLAGARRLTMAGALVGTPRYIAPEVARGAQADARSDLWAVALILYELLLGQPAYPGPSSRVLEAIVAGAPVSLRSRAPHLPPLLLDVVDAALQHDPAARFASATAFRTALQQATASRPVRRTTRLDFATGSLGAFDDDDALTVPAAPPPASPPGGAAPTPPPSRGGHSKGRRYALYGLAGGLLLSMAGIGAALALSLSEDEPTPATGAVAAPSEPIARPGPKPPAAPHMLRAPILRGCEKIGGAATLDELARVEEALGGALDCPPGVYSVELAFTGGAARPDGAALPRASVPECVPAHVRQASLDGLVADDGRLRCVFE